MIKFPDTDKEKKMWKEAPERCPFTKLRKYSRLVMGKVVYITEMGLDCYTIPIYDEATKAFYRYHYEIAVEQEEYEKMVTLKEITKNRADIEEIKKIYGIEEEKDDGAATNDEQGIQRELPKKQREQSRRTEEIKAAQHKNKM